MQQSFHTPGPIRVDVGVPSGTVEVDAADVEETIVDVDASDELLRRTTVELRGDELRVEVRNRDGFFISFTREAIRVRIRCPRDSSLAVSSKSADVVATGTYGDVRVRTASGDVSVETAGALDVQSASGDVTAGAARGRVSIQVVSGDVRLRDAAGDVRAQSVSGDIAVDRVAVGEARFEAVSGDVEVGIARGSRLHVDAFTLSGDTRSELELGDAHEAGDDGPLVQLRVKTVSGDIAVVRAATPTPQEV
jgi:DUF4097 and DUF4098 domain-containing protein YvlB